MKISTRKESNSAAKQLFKTPEFSPNLRAEFNPGEKDQAPCVSTLDEPHEDEKPHTALSVQYHSKWRRAAIRVTIASLAVSIIFSGISFFASVEDDSSSVLASAFDTLLAVVGSVIVLWRFRDDKNSTTRIKRERTGSLVFGAAFVLNGAVMIGVSMYHLEHKHRATGTLFLIILLFVDFCVYCVLAALEFYISRKLKSSVLAALCVDDALSAALHLGLSAGALIYERQPFMWYLDHYSAIAVSSIILLCGIKILVDVLLFKDLPFKTLVEVRDMCGIRRLKCF